jgi:hypothetical protein
LYKSFTPSIDSNGIAVAVELGLQSESAAVNGRGEKFPAAKQTHRIASSPELLGNALHRQRRSIGVDDRGSIEDHGLEAPIENPP